MTKNFKRFAIPPTLRFRLLNRREMAALLGCSTRTLDRMIAAERIPYLRIPCFTGTGTRVRFDTREIEEWLKKWHYDVATNFEEYLQLMLGDEQDNFRKDKL